MELISIGIAVLESGERLPLLGEGSPLGVLHAVVTRFVPAALRPRDLKARMLRIRVGALG